MLHVQECFAEVSRSLIISTKLIIKYSLHVSSDYSVGLAPPVSTLNNGPQLYSTESKEFLFSPKVNINVDVNLENEIQILFIYSTEALTVY